MKQVKVSRPSVRFSKWPWLSKWGDSKIQRWKDLEPGRLEEDEKTKGFFKFKSCWVCGIQITQRWRFPRFAFWGNFSEYPLPARQRPRIYHTSELEKTHSQKPWPFTVEVAASYQVVKNSPKSQKRANSHFFRSFCVWLKAAALPYCQCQEQTHCSVWLSRLCSVASDQILLMLRFWRRLTCPELTLAIHTLLLIRWCFSVVQHDVDCELFPWICFAT